MKLINRLILTILISSVAFSSCKELDEETFSEITVETYDYTSDDILNVIGPAYFGVRLFYASATPGYTQEITTDEIVMPAYSGGWDDGGIYSALHMHIWTSEHPHIGGLWNNSWSSVINLNRIIEQIESGEVPVEEEGSKDALIAEMKVARAYYYWILMDNFGDIPLVKKPTNEFPEKVSREEVYQFIVEEITDAMPKLSENSETERKTRLNKWSAKTLLANVYLNAKVYIGEAQWDKVIEQCNDIINSGNYALEDKYSDVFGRNTLSSSEIIWAVQYSEIYGNRGFRIHHESLHTGMVPKLKVNFTTWSAASIKAVTQFVNTYDTTDQRYHETWYKGLQLTPEGDTCRALYERKGDPLIYTKIRDGIYNPENEGYRIKKFSLYEGANRFPEQTMPVFRYAEVLMMKAEALLRMGNSSEAATIVTEVRERNFEDADKATVSGSELEQDSRYNYGYWEDYEIVEEDETGPVEYGRMLDELGWEFVAELHRRRDMIRFGVYTTKMRLSMKSSEDYRKVFPLPKSFVDANDKVEQHEDYK